MLHCFDAARADTVDELEYALRSIAMSREHLPSAVRALKILLRANCPEKYGDKVSIERAPQKKPQDRF